MKTKLLSTVRALMLLSAFSSQLATADAQGTAFTYQGRLNDGGAVASGSYDVAFALFDTNSGGLLIAGPVTNHAVAVSNGLFTTLVDFGAGYFPGADRWLELAVQTNGGSHFAPLAPRQQLTPTPYALTAGNLTTALPASGLSGEYSNSITLDNPANQINGTFSGDGTSVSNVDATALGGLGASSFWQTTGNSGTQVGQNFVGTTDNQPLEFWVNNGRGFRIEPTSGGVVSSVVHAKGIHPNASPKGGTGGGGSHPGAPNIIGGGSGNAVAPGIEGAVIAGGGFTGFSDTAKPNNIGADFDAIGGGEYNSIGSAADRSVIAGGHENSIQSGASVSFIGGGEGNTIAGSAFASAINGGVLNTIQTGADHSTVGGGFDNNIQSSADFSTVAGGNANTIGTNATFSTLSGGQYNTIQPGASYAFIGGGLGNSAGGSGAMAMGTGSAANNNNATSIGFSNSASGDSSIAMGNSNFASGDSSVALGNNNTSGETGSTAMGVGCWAGGPAATAIGQGCVATNLAATAMGFKSVAGGDAATAIGNFNVATGTYSVAIGNHNVASGNFATAFGGVTTASGAFSTAMGIDTMASGEYSTALGHTNTASGDYSTAMGNGTVGSGTNSTALGYTTTASGVDSIAMGAFTVAGGYDSTAMGAGTRASGNTSVAMGAETSANGDNSTAMGESTVAQGSVSTAMGGSSAAIGDFATAMGASTTASGVAATAMGESTVATNEASTAMGYGSVASGDYSTAMGYQSTASGPVSFAAGRLAIASFPGSFVWADLNDFNFEATVTNGFFVRCTGGAKFVTGIDNQGNQTSGVRIVEGGTAWDTICDRNAKKNFVPVDYQAILAKLAQVPISQWNYKWQKDTDVPNIGPMAQDFKSAFYPGRDDKSISTLEFDGVELAAIQGLNQKSEEKEATIQRQSAEIADLKTRLEKLEQLVSRQLGGAK